MLPELAPADPYVKVLERTADEIIERGWCQGIGQDVDGRVCLLKALELGLRADVDESRRSAWSALIHDLERPWGPLQGRSVSGWNDTKGRTKQEVLALIYTEIERRRG